MNTLLFRMQPENKDMWMNEDLWAYSRHPNYFGELLMWWGTFIMCICSATEKIGGNNDEGRHWAWVTIASPLFITALLLGFSGMPLLEAGLNR